MYYIISSYLKYYESTYPILVDSLLKSGIQSSQIIFVVGGSHLEESHTTEEGVKIVFRKYNSFDLTGLIYIAENLHEYKNYNNYFLLHDTCKVLPHFKDKSLQYSMSDIVKPLTSNISMNIGMYSAQCLSEQLGMLSSIKFYPNTPKDLQDVKTFFVQNEDIIFNRYEHKAVYNAKWKVLDEVGYYNRDNVRTVELFEDIGIIKIKANTQTKAIWNVEL